MLEYKGKYSTARVMIDNIEDECVRQIYEFINHPAFTNDPVIMPDTHAGKGAVVGFTMKTTEKMVPSVVGVDIGCSVYAMNFGNVEVKCNEWDNTIRKYIPFGFEVHASPIYDDLYVEKYFKGYDIKNTLNRIGMDYSYFCNSIGTVGGG